MQKILRIVKVEDLKRTVRETDVLTLFQPQAGTCDRICLSEFNFRVFNKDIVVYKKKKDKRTKTMFISSF